jgi:hypothetical protein
VKVSKYQTFEFIPVSDSFPLKSFSPIAQRLAACAVLGMLLLFAGAAQAQEGWMNMFDGKTLNGWTTLDKKPVPPGGWVVEADGALHRAKKAQDIYTEKEYANFVLEFEWKISAKANSGVKYRTTYYGKQYLGPEYQILDDAAGNHAGRFETASLYELFAPNTKKTLNPVGEWNKSKIVANGTKIEHWLNGGKVVDVDTSQDDFKKAIAGSKFKKYPNYAQNPSGRIMLQEHGGEVWFKNVRIQVLPSASKPGH